MRASLGCGIAVTELNTLGLLDHAFVVAPGRNRYGSRWSQASGPVDGRVRRRQSTRPAARNSGRLTEADEQLRIAAPVMRAFEQPDHGIRERPTSILSWA